MKISELQAIAWEQAEEKGFHEDKSITIGDRIALIHSEVSEAMEAFRKHGYKEWKTESGKPEGLASEIADVVIRCADFAHVYGLDLQGSIEKKLAYNKTRPYLHGVQKTNPLGRL